MVGFSPAIILETGGHRAHSVKDGGLLALIEAERPAPLGLDQSGAYSHIIFPRIFILEASGGGKLCLPLPSIGNYLRPTRVVSVPAEELPSRPPLKPPGSPSEGSVVMRATAPSMMDWRSTLLSTGPGADSPHSAIVFRTLC